MERQVAGFASVEHTQHVGYQEDQQYGAQPYARTQLITFNFVTIVQGNTGSGATGKGGSLDNASQSAYIKSERDFLPLIQIP